MSARKWGEVGVLAMARMSMGAQLQVIGALGPLSSGRWWRTGRRSARSWAPIRWQGSSSRCPPGSCSRGFRSGRSC